MPSPPQRIKPSYHFIFCTTADGKRIRVGGYILESEAKYHASRLQTAADLAGKGETYDVKYEQA